MPSPSDDHLVPRVGLRLPEVARSLGISERSVWDLIHNSDLPHVRLGRSIVVPVDLLRAWLEQRTRAAAQAANNTLQASEDTDKPQSREAG